MKVRLLYILLLITGFVSCNKSYEHKTVICIPVYGQSLALGEEATRITDFDSLANYADGRIVTENLDHDFGYFDNDDLKRFAKKMVGYQKRSFELTIYSMSEMLADSLGNDTIICIFPGGQGTTSISDLGKGSEPYQKLLDNIETAYQAAKDRNWDFIMPALCWMQGETDIVSYPSSDYRKLLLQFAQDINNDVKRITGQKQNIEFVCYQTNPVSRAEHFNSLAYDCPESEVAQTLMELVRDNPRFHASGPTYPYNHVREAIHIDGQGQRRHGILVAQSVLDILRHKKQLHGLLPLSISCQGYDIIINFNVPTPPLVIDTIQVSKITNYGFNVITADNYDITQSVNIEGNNIRIVCSAPPNGCRVRYAINGEKMKSGPKHGPRGNIRDSQDHWCWQFDYIAE